jgi:hypothetical protein
MAVFQKKRRLVVPTKMNEDVRGINRSANGCLWALVACLSVTSACGETETKVSIKDGTYYLKSIYQIPLDPTATVAASEILTPSGVRDPREEWTLEISHESGLILIRSQSFSMSYSFKAEEPVWRIRCPAAYSHSKVETFSLVATQVLEVDGLVINTPVLSAQCDVPGREDIQEIELRDESDQGRGYLLWVHGDSEVDPKI